MKICHVITRLVVGGAQENTLLTCEGLHDKGHQVLLLAGPDTGPEGSLWNQANHFGYQTQIIPALHRNIRLWDEWRAVQQIRSAYQKFRPDIIHTHSSKAGILARQAAKAVPNAKVIHTIHGMSFNRTQSWLAQCAYRFLEKRAARQTDQFVSVAQAMTNQSIQAHIAPIEKFVTLYSGMNTDWFKPDAQHRKDIRSRWGFQDHHVVVGTVARLFPNKGYEQLIPAIASTTRKNPSLRFVWTGDGAGRQYYVNKLTRLGLSDKVLLTGLVPPHQVPLLMQGLDILVHCSQWEGLPRALPQALLLEIPVISFDNDGAPEVVAHHQTGLLVPLNDIHALSNAILELAHQPQLRQSLGRAGRNRCLTQFDYHHMVEQLEQLYQQLLHPC